MFNLVISTKICFSSTKVRMDIRHLMKSTKQNDWEKFHRSIDEDRNMVIQVCSICLDDRDKTYSI